MPAYCRFKADRENDFVVVLPIAFIVNFTAYVQVNRCFQPTIRPYLPAPLLIYIRQHEGRLEVRLAIRVVLQQRLPYIRAYTNTKWTSIAANPGKKDCRLPHSEVGDNALYIFF